jgi:hypothetical protein
MLRQLMQTNLATLALTRGWPRWRSIHARRASGSRTFRRVARACMRPEVRLQAALSAAVRSVPRPKPKVAGAERQAPAYAPGEKGTLEAGSWIVLGTLGLGLELGRWPAWTALAAAGGYMLWVVAYSEATVQVRRRWPEARRLVLSGRTSGQPPAAPPKEHRTA